jgi:glycerol-3-phosphate acyltransferase PlsY
MTYEWLIAIGFIVLGYLSGSISSAIVVCKLLRLPDPRQQGSGNPGATNVLRVGGKKAAIITLAGDIVKGLIPVLLARWYGLADVLLACVAIAAFVGHLFPVFFGFRGGKGVATAFGAILGLNAITALSSLGVWIIVVAITRYSSLAAICATISIPIFSYIFAPKAFFVPLIVMAIIILLKHKDNIVRIVQGQESKIGQKKGN